MSMIKIRIEKGSEVIETLNEEFAKRGIRDGAICSVIGAVDKACISNMPKEDASKDILTEYSEPFEMNGCGEVREGKAHIHCNFGREGDAVVSGHLHWAQVDYWYVTAFVIPM